MLYELKNLRIINSEGRFDLWCDNLCVLLCRPYVDCYYYVLDNAKPDDTYLEPDMINSQTVQSMIDAEKRQFGRLKIVG